MSFIIDCYPEGVSNKHCLLSLFSFISFGSWFSAVLDNDNKNNDNDRLYNL